MMATATHPAMHLMPYTGAEVLPLYTTTVAVSAGGARRALSAGRAVSDDGKLDLLLTQPPELGGDGCGTNAQQLFAAGFASCFHGTMSIVAASRRLTLSQVDIAATVSFGRDPVDGLFLITAALEVSLPRMSTRDAAELVAEAERLCPYAKAARTGMHASVRLV